MVMDPVAVDMTLDAAENAVEEAMKYCADGTYVFGFGEITPNYPEDQSKQATWQIPVTVVRAINPEHERFVGNTGMIFAPIPPVEKKRRLDILVELAKGASQQLGIDIWPGNTITIEQLEGQQMVGTVSWSEYPKKSKNYFANYIFSNQKVE